MGENTEYKILTKIDSPADLRKLDVKELPALCEELRNDPKVQHAYLGLA